MHHFPPTDTYLQACLYQGLCARWPNHLMPLAVYIAPFRWYESDKQNQADRYRQMVLDAMSAWQSASQGRISFRLVANAYDSQIDLSWRRVDRKSLGHCKYLVNKQGLLYSAEIEIGVSDRFLHAEYDDPEEVRHTILHEFGHALGLVGHSDASDDIMYVPHQFGVFSLSARDKATLAWLYKLPPAFNYIQKAATFKLRAPFGFNDVLNAIVNQHPDGQAQANAQAQVKSHLKHQERQISTAPTGPQPLTVRPEDSPVGSYVDQNSQTLEGHSEKDTSGLDLDAQQKLLSQQGKFLMATQPVKRPPISPKSDSAKPTTEEDEP
ncbi:MAG: matrixin family metalloprotease [Vampirovibrionales bacterium]|nr:matrixin family metalloprotease [Vampirovibrionales bacterium]